MARLTSGFKLQLSTKRGSLYGGDVPDVEYGEHQSSKATLVMATAGVGKTKAQRDADGV